LCRRGIRWRERWLEELGWWAVCAELGLYGCGLDEDGAGGVVDHGAEYGWQESTYLRMAALLVVMAQMGCFVPAERMRLGLVDRFIRGLSER
jgi:DNA mismatch repair protein MutS